MRISEDASRHGNRFAQQCFGFFEALQIKKGPRVVVGCYVARRVLGENNELTLCMRRTYAQALYHDPGATLDHLREAVTTLEETERTARRVLGGAHPTTVGIGGALQDARAALRARETLSRGST